jgi:hypothetical protein
MASIAPVDVDLWISDDELAQLALTFERLVRRARRPERPAFFVDYAEVE